MTTLFNTDNVTVAGQFLSRQLEQRLPVVLQKKYPTLKFANGELLPAIGDLEAGAESLLGEMMATVGATDDALADIVDDVPFADVLIGEYRYPVRAFPIAFRYSVRELAAASRTGRPLTSMKEMAARRAVEEKVNRVGCFGDARYGMTGLINHPNTPVVQLNTNLYNPALPVADLLNSITSQVTKVVADTNLSEEPNTLLVPVRLHEILTNTQLPNTGSTLKKFILENNTYLTDIVPVVELSAANMRAAGVLPNLTRDSMFLYPLSPDTVARHYEPLTFLQPQLRGMDYVVIGYTATTGACVNYPGSMLRIDFLNS